MSLPRRDRGKITTHGLLRGGLPRGCEWSEVDDYGEATRILTRGIGSVGGWRSNQSVGGMDMDGWMDGSMDDDGMGWDGSGKINQIVGRAERAG